MSTNKLKYKRDPYGGKSIYYSDIDDKNKVITFNKNPINTHEKHSHVIVVGSSGCGKTSSLLWLVDKYVNLSSILICSLIEHPIFSIIEQYCKEHKIRYYFTMDIQESYDITMKEVEIKEAGTQGLIIYDDIMTGKTTNSSGKTVEDKILIHMFQKVRNYYCSCILLIQSYQLINTSIRNNANCLIYFSIRGRVNRQIFQKDAEILSGYSSEVINEILDECNELHSYAVFTAHDIYLYKPSLYKEGQILQPLKIKDF